MMKQQPKFEARWYYNLSLERLVPDDHLLRLIDRAVDFSFIRPLCRPFYSHTGRPSVDPVVLFKWFRAPRGAMCPRGLRDPPPTAAAVGRS